MAYRHSEEVLGLSRMDHLRIIMSSMGAQNEAKRVQVKRDPDSGFVLLRNGFGQEIGLEEDDAVALYQDLARSMELEFRASCPKCGSLLDEYDECGCFE